MHHFAGLLWAPSRPSSNFDQGQFLAPCSHRPEATPSLLSLAGKTFDGNLGAHRQIRDSDANEENRMRATLIAAVVLMCVASAAQAQDRAKAKALAKQLGVSVWTLAGCVRGSGGRPAQDANEEQRKAFARALYDCVSAKNPGLTRDTFKAALLEMRR